MDLSAPSAADGVFTIDDALAAGYSRDQVRYRVRAGHWLRVRKGLYVEAGAAISLEFRERLIVALRAAQRRIPNAAASHHTAAMLHGLALYGPTGGLTLTRDCSPRAKPIDYPGVRVQRAALPTEHLTEVDGVLTTTIARTVCDRARTSGFRAGVVTADSALARGLARESLISVLEQCRRWPGRLRGLEVARFAEPLTESPLESVSRVFFRDRVLPAPAPQALVRNRHGIVIARTDFLWVEEGVVGEADGDIKYVRPWEQPAGSPLTPLLVEKRRQEAVESEGLLVVRWDLDGLLRRGDETERRIRAAFQRAARLRGPAA